MYVFDKHIFLYFSYIIRTWIEDNLIRGMANLSRLDCASIELKSYRYLGDTRDFRAEEKYQVFTIAHQPFRCVK